MAVRWRGCNVSTHLKEPVAAAAADADAADAADAAAAAAADDDDAGRRAGGGSSHPGSGNREVQAYLSPPTGVSVAGCQLDRDHIRMWQRYIVTVRRRVLDELWFMGWRGIPLYCRASKC